MTLAEAEAAECAPFAAIGRLGEVELAAVKAWIGSNCELPRPQADAEARRVLTDRLMAAMEERAAAERAAGGRRGADGSIAPTVGKIAATACFCGAAKAA